MTDTPMLDSPQKIAALIGLLVFLRIVWGLWEEAPYRRFAAEALDSALIAFILVFVLVRPFVVQAFFIPSPSMVPTLRERDRILVNRFIYSLTAPQRGDVIVFHAPRAALYPMRRIRITSSASSVCPGIVSRSTATTACSSTTAGSWIPPGSLARLRLAP